MLTFKYTSKSDVFLVMIALWWSVVLLFNETLFEGIPTIYMGVAMFAGQKVWAFVFILSAILSMIGIVFNNGYLRKTSLMLYSFLYALICAGYMWSNAPFHTGTGVYFAISVLCLWRLREVKIIYAR